MNSSDRGFAGAAAADDAVEAVAELEPQTVQEAAVDRQADDPVMRLDSVSRLPADGYFLCEHLVHAQLLLADCSRG